MWRSSTFVGAVCVLALPGCASSPIIPYPPGIPLAQASTSKETTNAGRVESIAVNPTNRDHAIIAMEFGGLWKTHGGGNAWFRIVGLPAVFVRDVEFGSDGKTVVAVVSRDNGTVNGGGIYVSRDGGDSWTRPPTGMVPGSNRTPDRTSAHSVSHAPDERGLWYVGTDFGIAISRDNGGTWTHASPENMRLASTGVANPLDPDLLQDGVQSVLAMPGGRVLAMTRTAVERSDDRGATWRKAIVDDFQQGAPGGGEPGIGGNKMDRSPYESWAFIFKSYGAAGGKIWFYELDSEAKTLLPMPQGNSRGPFIRVSKDKVFGGRHISIWVGAGWDGYYVTRETAESIRSIRADNEWNDWASFITPAGIHADMGDMGVNGELQPAFLGSDGGVFKPHPTIARRWISAAVPGSGMNSFQIMDLAGTNVSAPNGNLSTHLYFGTQDNKIWASRDGGATWPYNHAQEGYGLEVRGDAGPGESITVGFRAIGVVGEPELRFTDALLANSRPVPDRDGAGQPLTDMGIPFFLSQQVSTTSKPSYWVRLRYAATAEAGVYVSSNSGSNWVKTGNLNFMPAGEIKRTAGGIVAWVPVSIGGNAGIGLVALTPTVGLFNNTIQTYDDSDVVRLPGGGSLNKRAAPWDTHAVFGVHPIDWKFLIAPDFRDNNVKVSRDGGKNWITDAGLTQQVLRGGQLKLWDDSPYRMQVTEIAWDPYFNSRYGNRIFVGTRDAGIICSQDGGQSWRTIKNSDEVKYITGFHFHPSGGVYVSSLGHGIWYVKPTQGCPESYKFPWDMRPPVFDPFLVTTGAVARTEMPPPPRGVADPNLPKLFLRASVPSGGVPGLGKDNVLTVSGRSFPPGNEVALTIRRTHLENKKVRVDERGRFAITMRFPEDLPYGMYTIEAFIESGREHALLSIAEFVKAYSDGK